MAVALAPSESDDAPSIIVVVDDELPQLTILEPDAGHTAPVALRPRGLRAGHDAGQDAGDCASPDPDDAAVVGADAGMDDAGQRARRRPRAPVEASRGPKPDAGERVIQELVKGLRADDDDGDEAVGCVAAPPVSPLVMLAVGWALSRRRRIG